MLKDNHSFVKGWYKEKNMGKNLRFNDLHHLVPYLIEEDKLVDFQGSPVMEMKLSNEKKRDQRPMTYEELTKFYNCPIEYLGLVTNFQALQNNGWQITHKPAYRNWRDTENSAQSNEYIYIRHPVQKLIGRLVYWPGQPLMGKLQFLTHEKNQRVKPPKYVSRREYTEEDIAPMLEIIQEIQNRRPKKKRELPEADIINLSRRKA